MTAAARGGAPADTAWPFWARAATPCLDAGWAPVAAVWNVPFGTALTCPDGGGPTKAPGDSETPHVAWGGGGLPFRITQLRRPHSHVGLPVLRQPHSVGHWEGAAATDEPPQRGPWT